MSLESVITELVDELAERDLLGALILASNSENIADVSDDLFATQNHKDIAGAIVHLIEHRIPVDYLELVNELRRRSKDVSVAYISDLGTAVVLARPIARRVAYLRELAQRRLLAKLGEHLPEMAANLTMPLEDIKAMVLEVAR